MTAAHPPTIDRFPIRHDTVAGGISARPVKRELRHAARHEQGNEVIREVAMALAHMDRDTPHAKRGAKDSLEYRLIFMASFVFFFFATIVERLLPWSWAAQKPQSEQRRSIFQHAKEAAGTCTTYAFMG